MAWLELSPASSSALFTGRMRLPEAMLAAAAAIPAAIVIGAKSTGGEQGTGEQ